MIKKIAEILLILFFIVACDEDITYRTEFEEMPVLYSVINADTNLQYVMLKKSFEEKNSVQEKYIGNATVKFITENEIIDLKDTTVKINNIDATVYYTDNFKPAIGTKIKVTALLPNGKNISSEITVPNLYYFYVLEPEIDLPPVINPEYLVVNWVVKDDERNLYFVPRLLINYKIKDKNGTTEHSYEIAEQYIIQEGKKIPLSPIPSRNTYIWYKQKVINDAFNEISKGDKNKSKYIIKNVTLKIFVLEKNLAKYSAAVQSFNRGFTVKLYEPIISNISGGVGVFGAFLTKERKVKLNGDYVESFGYKFQPDN